MVKHTQTARRLLQTNYLNVFDYFVKLALKELKTMEKSFKFYGKSLPLDPSKDFHFNFPHPQSSKIGSSWLIKGYTGEEFWKFISFFIYNLLKSLQ